MRSAARARAFSRPGAPAGTGRTMLEERPDRLQHVRQLNWLLPALICLLALVGFTMLRSVGGDTRMAELHLAKFAVGMALFAGVSLVDVKRWQVLALPVYLACLALLLAVPLLADGSGSADRWLQVAGFRFQPSELAKVGVILAVAALFSFVARGEWPAWLAYLGALPIILLPVLVVYSQPDLGTALLILAGGLAVVFLGGVPVLLVLAAALTALGAAGLVFWSRGTSWQVLHEYQYRRIDVFLNPNLDPLGASYNRLQSEIAFGSGGLWGRGYMRGPQVNLEFLPEYHTDFVFAALAEQFGFVGTMSVLLLHLLVLAVLTYMMMRTRDRFARLLIGGVQVTFFLYFGVNMWMVVGLFPVVGVPLPLISHGGSAMWAVLFGLGLAQSAYASRSVRHLR